MLPHLTSARAKIATDGDDAGGDDDAVFLPKGREAREGGKGRLKA